MKAKILVLDDDDAIRKVVVESLTRAGFFVTGCASAEEVLASPIEEYDLLLLDVMMPGMDGFTLCRRLRDQVDVPILFLTAKGRERDAVEGLALGGDDYLRKPFRPKELVSRIEAHLRRERRQHHVSLRCGEVRCLLTAREVRVKGETVALTKREYDICELLIRNQDKFFPGNRSWKRWGECGLRRNLPPSQNI